MCSLGQSEDYAPLELRRRGSWRDLTFGFEVGHTHGTISGSPSVKVKEAFCVVTSDIDPRAAGFGLTGQALRRWERRPDDRSDDAPLLGVLLAWMDHTTGLQPPGPPRFGQFSIRERNYFASQILPR